MSKILIGKINKEYANKIRNCTFEYLYSVLGMYELTQIPQSEILYEVCEGYFSQNLGEYFYTQIPTQSGNNVQILSKDNFINYIVNLSNDTKLMYTELLRSITSGSLTDILSFLKSRIHYWDTDKLATLSLDNNSKDNLNIVTNSNTIEAVSFNLIHILKTFDWDNDYCLLIITE